MFYHAENGTVPIEGTVMDYIAFGTGKEHLLLLPGLGEGLQSIRGTAIPFAILYRAFAKRYRVHVFARRRVLPKSFSTREMAQDVFRAMETLGIPKAHVVGISMGGMIAQWLAADHPQAVDKLALIVTSAQPNETLCSCVRHWIGLAQQGDHKALMLDTAEKMYTERYLRSSRWMFGLIGIFTKPRSYDRFYTMADACLTHDAIGVLHSVTAPTLVIGGMQDITLTAKASEEIAEKIPHAKLYLYPDYGHSLYEEAKDFNDRLLAFLE